MFGISDYTRDIIHPSTRGAMRIGKVPAKAPAPVLLSSNVDLYANRASFAIPNHVINPW